MNQYLFSKAQASAVAKKLQDLRPVLAGQVMEVIADIAPDYRAPAEPADGWAFVDDGDSQFLEVPASNLTVLDSGLWSVAIGGEVWMG